MIEDKSKLQLIGEIAQANNKNLELIEELNDREDEIERLQRQKEELQINGLRQETLFKLEIERLNKLISQREKKWEKWTTEKTILSTKMSDYLCKYQNVKREYTKQIKISTDRKKEIERLNNIINELNNAYCKVITKCEEMIDSRFYMNDIAIKKYGDEIKDICKYYIREAKELKGSDKQ